MEPYQFLRPLNRSEDDGGKKRFKKAIKANLKKMNVEYLVKNKYSALTIDEIILKSETARRFDAARS